MPDRKASESSPCLSTQTSSEPEPIEVERILCNHCHRTATNGIRCLGMCVADNDY